VLTGGSQLWSAPQRCHPWFRAVTEGRINDVLTEQGLGGVLSAAALDLLSRLLALEPLARPTVDEALAHEWFR
jgi:hypothetical protein